MIDAKGGFDSEVLLVQNYAKKRAMHLQATVVFDEAEPSFRNRFMKKFTLGRVVPIISARVS